MKWLLDVAYIAIGAGYKWILGMVVIVGVTVGTLYATGVLGGSDESDDQGLTLGSIPTTPTVTPTISANPTPMPTLVSPPTSVPVTPTPIATIEPTAAPHATVSVPIYLEGAANVGSLEFILVYEPTVLIVTKVEQGALTSNALLEYSATTPGLVWAGMIDANGISGDGPAAVVTFEVIGSEGSSSALTVKNVVAHDATTLLDIIAQTSPGIFTLNDSSITPPSMKFAP